MGYVDKFYYGQAKLIVAASSGTEIEVSDGTRTWSDTVGQAGKVEFLVPGTKEYSVSDGNDTKSAYLSFGDCQMISM